MAVTIVSLEDVYEKNKYYSVDTSGDKASVYNHGNNI
jgi:hypothetical protein